MVEEKRLWFRRYALARAAAEGVVFLVVALLVAQTAVMAKKSSVGPALVAFDHSGGPSLVLEQKTPTPPAAAADVAGADEAHSQSAQAHFVPEFQPQFEIPGPVLAAPAPAGPETFTPAVGFSKYFDGRPIRPVKTIWMTVTAYSPDERSCAGSADGYTATNHSVWTNAMRLVAADPRLLPYGSLLSVPGYAEGEIVPVLDCGGAIKGRRLDVLYATHEVALKWGKRRVQVTVWEYADGKPSNLGHRKRG